MMGLFLALGVIPLLALGIVVMAIFFTGWGLWEVLSLPPAPLP